jgi:imidazolonepropionase-like amidohydrolase
MLRRRGVMALPLACAAVLAAADLPYRIPSLTPVAFVNVNVAPMDAERILERHTVVVRDGRVAALGPAESVEIPAEAEVIDAAGMYLMPGLADMHTHFTHGDPAWRNNLFLFVANGVTTVREMWGEAVFLNWRDAVASGSVTGPRV